MTYISTFLQNVSVAAIHERILLILVVLQVATKAEYKLKPYPSGPYPGEWEGRVAGDQFSRPRFLLLSVFF